MASGASSIDYNDQRQQYTPSQSHFEPSNTRPRASSNVRGDGYRPDQSRLGQSQQPFGEIPSAAFAQTEPHGQVPPELIAQITANVISQLKTTGLDSVSPIPPANPQFPPPPPVQRPAPLSPPTDTTTLPPTQSRRVYTPPSPQKYTEFPKTGSPQPQPPVPQPNPTYFHEPFSAPFQDRGASSPLSQTGESGYSRPKGPRRLSTSKEETTLEKIWGQLFDEESHPTVRLGQLLRGLAVHIIEDYEPRHSIVITPTKLLKYYEDVKLPDEIYPWPSVFDDDRSSISRIYRELGCQHHLVQEGDDQRPEIPSLTPVGFQRWVTLLIQAHPDQEYERLQKAVLDMPISNPDDKKERFPKECSRRLFPVSADHRIRERLERAICKHAKVDLHTNRGGSPTHRPSIGAESVGASATPRPSLSVENPYIPPSHRREASVDVDSTSSSAVFGTSIERERAPYSNILADAAIEDTTSTSTPLQPLERERKPYSAVPGGGKAYDDESRGGKPRAESIASNIDRSTSSARARPTSMGFHGPRPMDTAKPEFPHHHPVPPSTRRRRSPSFSGSNHEFRRSENDIRSYPAPFQAPSAPPAEVFDDEARRYARDRARRPVDDDGRDYSDGTRGRYERGSYPNEEEFYRNGGRGQGGGYDYSPASYGGSTYRS